MILNVFLSIFNNFLIILATSLTCQPPYCIPQCFVKVCDNQRYAVHWLRHALSTCASMTAQLRKETAWIAYNGE